MRIVWDFVYELLLLAVGVVPSHWLTGAFICSHVIGRESPETDRNSKQLSSIRGFSRRVIPRCGSVPAKASRLAWSSHTENVQKHLRANWASRP